MCNHENLSGNFEYCPYCGAKLPTKTEEKGFKEVTFAKPVYTQHSHWYGIIETERNSNKHLRVPLEKLDEQGIVRGMTKEEGIVSFYNADSFANTMRRIEKAFGTDTFTRKNVVDDRGITTDGELAQLRNAGMIGIAGTYECLVEMDTDQYGKVYGNRYVINPKWKEYFKAACEAQMKAKDEQIQKLEEELFYARKHKNTFTNTLEMLSH